MTLMTVVTRVALITGGASGIGLATARRYVADDIRVCLVDVNPDVVAVADELGGLGVVADVRDANALDGAFIAAVERFGGVDVAILNAGTTCAVADPAALDVETYRRVMGVNLDGVVFGTMAAARHMAGGALVATASLAGLTAFAPDPAYTASKHAVVAWVRSVAPTLAANGILAHAVCPGFTDTPLLGDAARDLVAGFDVPLMDPDEVAAAILRAEADPEPGSVWVCQPGRTPEPYRFPGVPGPGSG